MFKLVPTSATVAAALLALGLCAPACKPVMDPAKGSGSSHGSGSAASTHSGKKAAPKTIKIGGKKGLRNLPAKLRKLLKQRLGKGGKRVMHSGAHILIAYKGARRAKPNVTRTKDEAKAFATKLAAKLKKAPKQFAAMAKKHSNGPSGRMGGDLGIWPKGRMVPAFDKAIAGLKVGEVTPAPVETPFGFHVIIRYKVLPAVKLTARMILVAWKGALRANPKVTRSKADAAKLAKKIVAMATKVPKSFVQLVAKYSDGPGKKRKGLLPTWNSHGRRMPRAFTRAVRPLKENAVSEVVETPFGFHIFMRLPPPPTFAGSHVLVAYKGAMRARKTVTRSKAEAKSLATKIAAQLKKDPSKFKEVAATKSDGPSARRGGKLGKWTKGSMVPAFDNAIEKLKIGQVSDPVESPFGFHVIMRHDPKKM